MDDLTIGGPNDKTQQQIFADLAAQQAAQAAAREQSPQAKGLRFAVGIGILAYGIAKHNTYVTIVGGGFLAYWLVTGQLVDVAPAPAITMHPPPPTAGVVNGINAVIHPPPQDRISK